MASHLAGRDGKNIIESNRVYSSIQRTEESDQSTNVTSKSLCYVFYKHTMDFFACIVELKF